MKEKGCVICYKGLSTAANSKTKRKAKFKSRNANKRTFVLETEEKCVTLEDQLPVIFLLRKLLNIPEEMCTKFLENNGNPVSWIFWCDACAKLIRDAEHLFKEIQELQEKLNSVGSYLKNAIILSADVGDNCGKIVRGGASKKTKRGPAEEIRSYIIQEFQSLEHSKVKIKVEEDDDYDVDTEMNQEGENIDDEFINSEPTEDCTSEKAKLKSKTRSPLRKSIKEDENDWKPEENDEDSDFSCEETLLDLKSDISDEQNSKIGKKKTFKKRNGFAKCEICFRQYSFWSSLRRHILRAHGELPYSCDHCELRMITKEELEKHKEKFRCERKTIFFCDICNKDFTSKSKMMKHRELSHTSEEEKKNAEEIVLKCEKCDEKYKRVRDLRVHCKKMHSEDFGKLFPEKEEKECKICGMNFARSSTTKEHYKLKHLEEFKIKYPGCRKPKEFKCTNSDCNYKTNANNKYQLHLKTHFSHKERSFVCDICGESFTEKKYLEYHQHSKHFEELGLNPFKCDQCGKMLNSPFYLRRHIRTIHQNAFKFTCPVCNKGLDSKSSYDVHMKRHEGIKTALCPECGATFVSQSMLNSHVKRAHRTDRPFSCKQCPKTFKVSSQFNRHVKSVHSNGVNPYKCEFCPKAFPIRNYLYIHLRSHRKKNKNA